jgi:Flp pilus assembly CpaE family ATPase
MKCRASWSVRDALDNMHRMDSNYWQKLASPYSAHLDMISAPDDLAARRPAGPQETAHLMRFIRSAYKAAVVDFGRHVSTAAFDSLPELDLLYLVTTLDLDSLDRAGECLRLLDRRGYPQSRVRLLVNRVPERGAADPAGVEKYLGVPCAASFSADHTSLYDAWSEGRLLEANTKLGREFHALSESMVSRVRGEIAEVKTTPRAAAGNGVGRLFSFLNKPASKKSASAARN